MSTCLFSYIHAVFNLQTLPSTFLCHFGMYSIVKYMPRMNTDRIFVTFPAKFVMLQKLTELSLSTHMQLFLRFELLGFM